MTSIQEGTQVAVTHVGQSHPAKTFNGSHLLNIFTEQPILNAWKGSGCQRRCQISEKVSHKHSVRPNVWYPPLNLCVYNPSLATTHWRTNTPNYAHKNMSSQISDRVLNTPLGLLHNIQKDQPNLVFGIMSQESVFVYVSAFWN